MVEKLNHQAPLTGVNVIEFGHYYAGPMASMLLADQGANVIRIVKPGESELCEQQYRLLNRNKKLLYLDLKLDQHRTEVMSMIEHADVIIENFRPGVMQRLGLDYPTVKKDNPGIVYLSLPGFASTDKKRAHLQAWEGVIAAAAGMYTEAHLFRQKLNFPPVYTSVPLCSAFASMHGAVAIMAALIAREECGVGTVIEVPLVEAGLAVYPDQFMVKASVGFKGPSASLRALARPDSSGLPDNLKHLAYSAEDSPSVQMEKLEKAHDEMQKPYFYQLYETRDKRKMLTHTADKKDFVTRYFRALGLEEQVKREGFVNEGPWGLGFDNNLSDAYNLSPQRRQRIVQLIAEAYIARTAEEWESIFEEAGIPGNYIRTRDEWLASEPMLASGVFTLMDDGKSVLTVPGRVVDVSGPDGALIAPLSHELEIIDLHDATKLMVTHVTTKHQPNKMSPLKKSELLSGLKVLDMANVVAGPTAAYTLAQYGADIIRLDPSEYFHPLMLRMSIGLNQGKRSILANVNNPSGREILEGLVRWSDVVMHNVLDDSAKRLGITHVQLQKVNPQVVSSQLSAFGGTVCGVWEHRKGFDPLAQNASGVMTHYGTPESPQDHGGLSADLMGGVSLAFSSLLGIYQRSKTGYGSETRASLARAVTYNQLPSMISENGNSDWGEPRGQFATGPYWWQRLYACSNGWIYIATSKDKAKTLAQIVSGLRTVDLQRLESAFAERDCSYWLEKLDASDIACHRVVTVDDICESASIRRVSNEASDETASTSLDILRWDEHPCGMPVILIGPNWVRVGEAHSYKRLTPAPRIGEHTKSILEELGYKQKKIKELLCNGVVFEYLPALGNNDAYLFTQKK